jgi:ABC-type glycerol-3-phosphate transport system permease component
VALTGLAAACGSSNGTTASSSGVPAQLTVWRIFLLVQRRMARGLVAGAVKG